MTDALPSKLLWQNEDSDVGLPDASLKHYIFLIVIANEVERRHAICLLLAGILPPVSPCPPLLPPGW